MELTQEQLALAALPLLGGILPFQTKHKAKLRAYNRHKNLAEWIVLDMMTRQALLFPKEIDQEAIESLTLRAASIATTIIAYYDEMHGGEPQRSSYTKGTIEEQYDEYNHDRTNYFVHQEKTMEFVLALIGSVIANSTAETLEENVKDCVWRTAYLAHYSMAVYEKNYPKPQRETKTLDEVQL